MLNRDRDPL